MFIKIISLSNLYETCDIGRKICFGFFGYRYFLPVENSTFNKILITKQNPTNE